MAERRMFAKSVVESDEFLDMPATSRLLYFHLGMEADDDGFLNNPKTIMRMVGCSQDDLSLLVSKGFLIPFKSGVVVIRHWKQSNYIQKDRYRPTKFKDEMKQLSLAENVYTLDTSCIHPVSKPYTQDSIGKDRLELGKDNIYNNAPVEEKSSPAQKKKTRKSKIPPDIDEVKAYCQDRQNGVDANAWFDFYSSKGWMVGKNKMVDWKAAIRTWERNGRKENANGAVNHTPKFDEFTV